MDMLITPMFYFYLVHFFHSPNLLLVSLGGLVVQTLPLVEAPRKRCAMYVWYSLHNLVAIAECWWVTPEKTRLYKFVFVFTQANYSDNTTALARSHCPCQAFFMLPSPKSLSTRRMPLPSASPQSLQQE